MAEIRKSGKQTAARQRAREKAAEFREKQDKLEQLATDYFLVTDTLDDIHAAVEEEIRAARVRGERLSKDARGKADAVIGAMLDLGVSRSEVANRLGITTREVKKPEPTSPKIAAPSSVLAAPGKGER